MADEQTVHPDAPAKPKPFTIRLYGKLVKRLHRFSDKKHISPTSCAKLLLGEKLEQEGF